MAIKPKAVYTLVIDEDRDNVMSVMSSHIFNNGLMPSLMEWLKDEGLEQEYLQLQKEISKKEHELGWCKAPDCGHPDADKQKPYA